MVRDRIPRHIPLKRVEGRWIIIAIKVPRKKFRKVAKKAQIRVHARTSQNCLPMVEPESKMAAKLSNPTQSNRIRWSPTIE